jgi:hypothetical protein
MTHSALRCVVLAGIVSAAFAADTAAPPPSVEPYSEFQFVRLEYSDGYGDFTRRGRWTTDWPEAEQHLMGGVKRLTRVDVATEGRHMNIMDPALFDQPWLYAVEVGAWVLSEAEAGRLRDYLLRGGFLMVDDFHGSYEWQGFMESMRRVFPDRAVVDIPVKDSVFHVLYDLDDQVQIPGIGAAMRGVTYEGDGYTPHWRGIYDDAGRLMVVINFNMDLGDAWEHADVPDYALRYTTRAYQYAINYILYAMTH